MQHIGNRNATSAGWFGFEPRTVRLELGPTGGPAQLGFNYVVELTLLVHVVLTLNP